MRRVVILFLILTTLISGILPIAAQGDKRVPITTATAAQVRTVQWLGRGALRQLAWSPTGEIIAVAGSVGIWLYAADNLQLAPRLLVGHTDMVYSVAFSPDGSLLASGSGDGTVRLWDTKSGQLRTTLQGHTLDVPSVAFSPDESLLASGDTGGIVKLWDVKTGQPRATSRSS